MRLWLSSLRMTVGISVVDGIIVDAAPVVRKFVGQRLRNLVGWMQQHGGFKMVELKNYSKYL